MLFGGRLCSLGVINNGNFLHKLFCSIDKGFKLFGNFIGIIFLSTLLTFFTRDIFNDNNAVFIIYYMGCGRWAGGFAFTIHTHGYRPFLVFKSISNLSVLG